LTQQPHLHVSSLVVWQACTSRILWSFMPNHKLILKLCLHIRLWSVPSSVNIDFLFTLVDLYSLVQLVKFSIFYYRLFCKHFWDCAGKDLNHDLSSCNHYSQLWVSRLWHCQVFLSLDISNENHIDYWCPGNDFMPQWSLNVWSKSVVWNMIMWWPYELCCWHNVSTMTIQIMLHLMKLRIKNKKTTTCYLYKCESSKKYKYRCRFMKHKMEMCVLKL
jgi:hypothetical protein